MRHWLFAAPAAAVNLFSVQQDVQAGRQAASQVERQMPILRDAQVTSYVNAIVRLAGELALLTQKKATAAAVISLANKVNARFKAILEE